jgi:hypothetical protein
LIVNTLNILINIIIIINFGSEQEPTTYSFERGYGISDIVKAKNFMAS